MTIVVACNNDQVLRTNLLASPDLRGSAEVIIERLHHSAGSAHNAGLDSAEGADIVAFIHQDVYLPAGWIQRVTKMLAAIDAQDWAVAGVWGTQSSGQYCGRVWCNGGGREHVGLSGTHEVASLDEIVLLLNTRHGLQFDPDLPGFHLYATDLILQGHVLGLKSFCIDAPVVHNSRCNPQPLDAAYRAAYRYIQRKWAEHLPMRTCVVDVTRSGWPMYRQWARNEISRLRGKVRAAPPAPDSAAIAQRLGYEPDSFATKPEQRLNACSGQESA